MTTAVTASMADKIALAIRDSGSRICVGLDPDPDRMPIDDVFDFNRAIIDATHDLVAAYKPQFAFYEALGRRGFYALERTIRYIRDVAPGMFIIGDSKRGDIDSTAAAYAKAMFEVWDCDASTVVAYQGTDGLRPFLADRYSDRGIFVCCRTSNPSSAEIQDIRSDDIGDTVYERVSEISVSMSENRNRQVGLVVGATFTEDLAKLRDKYPEIPFLVPGVGAQGGDAAEVARVAGDLSLINSSRGIIYASNSRNDFDSAARDAVVRLRSDISA